MKCPDGVLMQEKRLSWWQHLGQSVNLAGVNLFLHVRGVPPLPQPSITVRTTVAVGATWVQMAFVVLCQMRSI